MNERSDRFELHRLHSHGDPASWTCLTPNGSFESFRHALFCALLDAMHFAVGMWLVLTIVLVSSITVHISKLNLDNLEYDYHDGPINLITLGWK